MALISDCPNELLLELFTLLPLKSVISARGVNQNWRRLIPLANIHPIRRELLDLYDTIITTTEFLDSREGIQDNLRPFDREAYISSLEQQQNSIMLPEEFRIWVLEWPARAVFRYLWPGLRHDDFYMSMGKPHGRCCLTHRPPGVSTLFAHSSGEDQATRGYHRSLENASALEVWDHGCALTTWLVLDCKDVSLKGILIGGEGNHVSNYSQSCSSWLAYLRKWMK